MVPTGLSSAVNTHPLLFKPSTHPLLVGALKVAPPVAVDRLMVQKFTVTVPTGTDIVCDAAVTLPIVIKLPETPDSIKFVTVVVVAAVKLTVAG